MAMVFGGVFDTEENALRKRYIACSTLYFQRLVLSFPDSADMPQPNVSSVENLHLFSLEHAFYSTLSLM